MTPISTSSDELSEAAGLAVVQDLGVLLRTSPPRAGGTRVIALDGRSGAGKSTLAGLLRDELRAPVVHLEELYGSWDGLENGIDLLVSEVFVPFSAGRTALVPRYDWIQRRWQAPAPLSPPELLVVEGVGAGARRAAAYVSVLVWLDATESTRKRRAMDRDGDTYLPHWDGWAAQEARMLGREATPERADAVLRTEAGPTLVISR